MFASWLCLISRQITLLRRGSRILAVAVVLLAFASPASLGWHTSIFSMGGNRSYSYSHSVNLGGFALASRPTSDMSGNASGGLQAGVPYVHRPNFTHGRLGERYYTASTRPGRSSMASNWADDDHPSDGMGELPIVSETITPMVQTGVVFFDIVYKSPYVIRKLAPPI